MITFKKVTEADEQLNSQIEELNRKVFPSAETTANLHFLAGLYNGASVDFIAVEDNSVFVGYTYVINFFQGSFIYYLAIEPDFQDKGYGTALLKYLREIQGNRPIALTIFTPNPDKDDYEECLRRKWFYVKNGYVDQKIPYPDEDNHRFDIHMNGYEIGYIELMAMLNKVLIHLSAMEGIIYRRLYDDDGAIISLDGKTLLKVPDVPRYRIPEGIEEIDIKAFKNRPHLKEIDIPYTVEWYTDYPMSNDAMRYAPKGLKVNYWNWPYPENCVRSDELEEEIANGFVDEFGAVYSKDGKCLLKCADVKNYKIREGTETVEKLAFVGCDKLECLYIPYTCPEESFDAILGGSDTVGAICFWDKPYVPEELDPNESWSDDEVFIDDKDVVYTIDRKRLLYARKGFTDNEYFVPEGTLTICDQAFLFHEGYLILSVPASIKVIGDDIFGKDGGKIVFRDK